MSLEDVEQAKQEKDFGKFQEFFFAELASLAKKKIEALEPHEWDEKPLNADDLSLWKEKIDKFKPPKRGKMIQPFVLFAKVNRDSRGGVKKPVPGLFLLRPVNIPGAKQKIENYTKKGFRLVRYYFPKPDELPPLSRKQPNHVSGWVLDMHEAGTQDAWQEVRDLCEQLRRVALKLSENSHVSQKLQDENENLKAQLAKLQAEQAGTNKGTKEDDKENSGISRPTINKETIEGGVSSVSTGVKGKAGK